MKVLDKDNIKMNLSYVLWKCVDLIIPLRIVTNELSDSIKDGESVG